MPDYLDLLLWEGKDIMVTGGYLCLLHCGQGAENETSKGQCAGLFMLGPENGTIRRCGPVEWVWPWWSRCVAVGMGFKTLILASWKPVLC